MTRLENDETKSSYNRCHEDVLTSSLHFSRFGYNVKYQLGDFNNNIRQNALKECATAYGTEFVQEKLYWLASFAAKPAIKQAFTSDLNWFTATYQLPPYIDA